jgi:circadian clock protein KaiC
VTDHLPRLETGIPGLDTILCGGLIEGASYIVQGPPGAGKTIFCNQIAFARVNGGCKVLYVTLLAETHARLFQSLSTLHFFDKTRLGKGIAYISVFQTLRDEGLSAVVDLLRQETTRQNAKLLVFDGLLSARDRAINAFDVKTFVAEVQSQAAFLGCTVLFLASTRLAEDSPEHTMVDGVIDLRDELVGARSVRHLQVLKSRGSGSLDGLHEYEITAHGVTAYPRTEAMFDRPSIDNADVNHRPIPSGVQGLDPLLGGGLPYSSVTLLLGPSGAGKTSFGLSFLNAASEAEPALHFGFYETPARLMSKASALGLRLEPLVQTGALKLMWQPLSGNLLDKLAHRLLDDVRRRGVKRLLIDALGGFGRAAENRERLVEFLATVTNELRAHGVTAMATWELHEFFGFGSNAPSPQISSMLDNLLLMRTVESEQRYKRTLSVLKVRDCAIEPATHEVVFSKTGLKVQLTQPGREAKAGHKSRPEP